MAWDISWVPKALDTCSYFPFVTLRTVPGGDALGHGYQSLPASSFLRPLQALVQVRGVACLVSLPPTTFHCEAF